jgi:hypothetical protein
LQVVGHEHLVERLDAGALQARRPRHDEGVDVEHPRQRVCEERVHDEHHRREHQDELHGDDEPSPVETVGEHAAVEAEDHQREQFGEAQ